MSFSVSSVGSWALQPLPERRERQRILPFQYPRSDRGHCNRRNEPPVLITNPLSVSSVGSWALQPPGDGSAVNPRGAFSILGRIVGTATQYPTDHKVNVARLSVSSVGSWALQPRMFPAAN